MVPKQLGSGTALDPVLGRIPGEEGLGPGRTTTAVGREEAGSTIELRPGFHYGFSGRGRASAAAAQPLAATAMNWSLP